MSKLDEFFNEITPSQLAKYIDHSLLKPDAVTSQYDKLCDEAVHFGFYSVCVNPAWVRHVARKLDRTEIKICSVISFPFGAMDSRSKANEAKNTIEYGANELDMVINIGALKSGDLKLVEEDINAVKFACGQDAILKVIIETSMLTNAEKKLACELSKNAGADFVKTSTGFSSAGASVEDVMLMRKVVGNDMGVKASGGITDFEKAVSMLKAGASRLGCGSSVAVISRNKSSNSY